MAIGTKHERIAALQRRFGIELRQQAIQRGKLRARGWRFYTFIGGAARFMFAWDSDRGRIDQLVRDLRECAAG